MSKIENTTVHQQCLSLCSRQIW